MGPRRLSTEEKVRRFWLRVKRSGENDCWLWQGRTDKDGYGVFSAELQFGEQRAHRVSYKIHFGVIPTGQYVLHKCDTRGCVNPIHLFLGTALDNWRDCIAKGRQVIAVGSEQGGAKLTESVISEIRRRYLIGRRKHHHPDNQKALASEYGVDQAQISRIITGSAWVHV